MTESFSYYDLQVGPDGRLQGNRVFPSSDTPPTRRDQEKKDQKPTAPKPQNPTLRQ